MIRAEYVSLITTCMYYHLLLVTVLGRIRRAKYNSYSADPQLI